MTVEAESAGDGERSAALDGWVTAFDRELDQSGDFATSVAAMRTHGCFDVRAVVERWVLANPSGDVTLVAVQPVTQEPRLPELQEPAMLRLVPEEAAAPPEAVVAPQEPVLDAELTSRKPGAASSPDIAYFRSLLQGGIERAQIDEAFPGFRLVIDEALELHESAAEPILSDIPAPPSREDLNDEIRGMRQKLQDSAIRGRRRWRTRN
jgi:hypothetical protein